MKSNIPVTYKDSFPAKIKQISGLSYRNVLFESKDSMIESFYEYIQIPENRDKKFKQNLQEFGLSDISLLLDSRTYEISRLFAFYKNNPHIIDNYIWFCAYSDLSVLTKEILI